MDDEPITLKQIGWTIVYGVCLGMLVNPLALIASPFAREHALWLVPAIVLGCIALLLWLRYMPWWADWFPW